MINKKLKEILNEQSGDKIGPTILTINQPITNEESEQTLEDVWAKPKEVANKVANYFETKTGLKRAREVLVGGPDRFEITYYGNNTYGNTYNIAVSKDNQEIIILSFYEKREIRSILLADPRLNYQNTSARIVKHKKRELRWKECNNYDDAIKAIDKWFDKKDW